jgi:phosphoribosyl-dephospho-CoA transferase
MKPNTQPRVHSLVRLRDSFGVIPASQTPLWAQQRMSRDFWAVVRRSATVANWCAAGIRGARRSERCAIWVPSALIFEVVTPEDLAKSDRWKDHPRRHLAPAFGALPLVAATLRELVPGLSWGPTGSVGMELATGAICATDSSDLDLILRADYPLTRPLALAIHRVFAPLAVRIDLLIETPLGGVALAEWALHEGPWLVRTEHGPRLTTDPWRRLPEPALS